MYESLFSSFLYLHVTREKLARRHLYKTFKHKMLMKLTPGSIVAMKKDKMYNVELTTNLFHLNTFKETKTIKDITKNLGLSV